MGKTSKRRRRRNVEWRDKEHVGLQASNDVTDRVVSCHAIKSVLFSVSLHNNEVNRSLGPVKTTIFLAPNSAFSKNNYGLMMFNLNARSTLFLESISITIAVSDPIRDKNRI
ncbi:hypothetical protein L596_029232 [Steinernema carpocapsae]|uniref:Uncharacterized protein n=1 Tax=Steinernema carpocapsae TaxID=34508 RepID=A0A4U5LU19_STECR|nr:hypothetical protein L596_029232 [Steinernema carpocapsae]